MVDLSIVFCMFTRGYDFRMLKNDENEAFSMHFRTFLKGIVLLFSQFSELFGHFPIFSREYVTGISKKLLLVHWRFIFHSCRILLGIWYILAVVSRLIVEKGSRSFATSFLSELKTTVWWVIIQWLTLQIPGIGDGYWGNTRNPIQNWSPGSVTFYRQSPTNIRGGFVVDTGGKYTNHQTMDQFPHW